MDTRKNKSDILSMTKIAVCVTVLCISSYLVFPLPFTPIVLSLHTVAVNLIGLILKPKHAFYTVAIYLIMGFMGLPVFSVGTAGPGKLFGPTGGFYLGFLFAVVAISLLKGKEISFNRYALVTIGIGIPVQYLFAVLFLLFHNDFNIRAAGVSVIPFIPGDIIKCLVASAAGVALNKVNNKY